VKALDLVGTHANQPPFRVVKERRATIVANFVQEERRPGAETDIGNLLLAGDWTDTRLPGTIEGAIRSGKTAAELIPQARNAAKPIAKKPRIVANVE